ncbi:hypothetical protein V6N11_049467 [Hibiscus sabdariffa]|uniref:Protein BIG GRAIN 1-like B n=1 Tax=Hibiscus sabdariffa TaxID=183260 RepID=A0ABR2NAC8_9ROSI
MHRRTPSFSSTLLDAIYRSIDDSGNRNEPALCHYRESTSANPVKKQSSCSVEKASSLKRAIMIEKWVEKQRNHGSAVRFNSASSSSDSSNGAESSYKEESRRSKPVKFEKPKNLDEKNKEQGKAKRENGRGFTKTKLKALEIYGELKKAKQPISPGGRITTFLNSIFNANAKKVKMCSNGVPGDANFHRKSKSTAPSPTAFSRSCLSKPPSSSNVNKRSVKFCPVSVIVGEDCRPCGHKFSSRNEVLKKQESAVGIIEDYDEEDDDASSCSSSDLFELDHLIGIGRCKEELPTTVHCLEPTITSMHRFSWTDPMAITLNMEEQLDRRDSRCFDKLPKPTVGVA